MIRLAILLIGVVFCLVMMLPAADRRIWSFEEEKKK